MDLFYLISFLRFVFFRGRAVLCNLKSRPALDPTLPRLEQIVEFDTSSEALIFTPEGSPIHGLTGGFKIERRVEHIIPERFWKPKGSSGVYEIYVEGSCNGLFGIDNMDPPDVSRSI